MSLLRKSACGVAILCFILMLAPGRACAQQSGIPDYISTQHRVVLERWLKQKPSLRVAVTEDLPMERAKLVKDMFPDRLAAPFYAVGDFNHDGQKDFAVGFVVKGDPTNLMLAVFNGPFGKRSAPAFYNEKRFDVNDLFFISTDKRKGETLQIGVGSDTRTVLLKPKGRGYYVWAGATE